MMDHVSCCRDREYSSSPTYRQNPCNQYIYIYEADHNLTLKYFWPNQATKHAVKNKTIDEYQWEGVPEGSADLVALINKFIIETHRLTFRNLGILQNNAKACTDRIINNHSTLHSRRFEIPDKVCRLHSTTLLNIKYRIQTALGIDTCHCKNTTQDPTHGWTRHRIILH